MRNGCATSSGMSRALDRPVAERKRITCPESAHLEEVDLERTPLGLVVLGCSKFEPRCDVACARECARRLDARQHSDDANDRVLIVYSRAAWTHPVADALADLLRHDHFHVELADADLGGTPPPSDYDAVVVGTPQRLGRRARPIIDYVSQYRDALSSMTAVWFCVGGNDRASGASMQRATGWLPAHVSAIVRPSWRTRWFGDPSAARAPGVRRLAEVVADETH